MDRNISNQIGRFIATPLTTFIFDCQINTFISTYCLGGEIWDMIWLDIIWNFIYYCKSWYSFNAAFDYSYCLWCEVKWTVSTSACFSFKITTFFSLDTVTTTLDIVWKHQNPRIASTINIESNMFHDIWFCLYHPAQLPEMKAAFLILLLLRFKPTMW